MTGPLTQEALDSFTKHLTTLCSRTMVLDPDSFGHEMYDESRGRYQWKVKGCLRSADHQGVALKLSGEPEVYVIRRNVIDVIVRIRTERELRHYSELFEGSLADVLPSVFRDVLTQMMNPYFLPHEEKD